MDPSIELSEPESPEALAEYFELRWRELRAPWHQPRGSERDEFEVSAHHVIARTSAGELVGAGRVHSIGEGAAQIRYMATTPGHRGRGIGTAILRRLEEIATELGADRIILNARDTAVPFYARLGYEALGDGPTMFGTITHTRMQKRLQPG